MFLPRTPVTANLTLYVSPTGNDAANGLTPGTAFATLQRAIDVVYYTYDWGGYQGTIQLADGTYNFTTANGYAGVFSGMPLGMRPGQLQLLGNVANPANVVVNATAANCLGLFNTWLILRGITFTASGSGPTQGYGVVLQLSAYLDIQSCRFGNCGYAQLAVANASQILMTGSGMTFFGTTPTPLWAIEAGTLVMQASAINVAGLTMSVAFVDADASASVNAIGATFAGAGSCTGPRYAATNNATIQTAGGGANFFPGSTPGATGTGGQYS
jgi:hypothetical protein